MNPEPYAPFKVDELPCPHPDKFLQTKELCATKGAVGGEGAAQATPPPCRPTAGIAVALVAFGVFAAAVCASQLLISLLLWLFPN